MAPLDGMLTFLCFNVCLLLYWHAIVSENDDLVAGCSSSSNTSNANVPYFNGEDYNLWSLMMITMFRSRELWNIVEKCFNEERDENRINESLKKDAKALYLIQQALDKKVLIRISGAKIAKDTWEILKIEFQGNENTVIVQLHVLHRELVTAKMRLGEKVQDYMLDEQVPEKTVIVKILRNMSTLTVEELSGSRKSHESILNSVLVEEAKKEEDEGKLFMASSGTKLEDGGTWLIDNGCPSHMSRDRSLSKALKKPHLKSFTLEMEYTRGCRDRCNCIEDELRANEVVDECSIRP
ncbi:P-loop containing nucleoside triphosphate hydrolase protein [Dioscorea alata]|uniref:P-loop containing nucleoside triphosphate hydrolase protein n=1 Tax=Dioscorea alata TaxID=55571 RepID=A0ACB7U5M5_DIOAL|nr:P-loop containing nucleoside triphosphate hydrolase protein [Dioscorea alata]